MNSPSESNADAIGPATLTQEQIISLVESKSTEEIVYFVENSSETTLLALNEKIAVFILDVYAAKKGILSIGAESGCDAWQALIKVKRYSDNWQNRIDVFNQRISRVFFEKTN